jgi:hypothetical protein
MNDIKAKYKKWVDNGRPLYHIDKSKEPTPEEHKIFHEMDKQQGKSYDILHHETGRKYTITEHNPEPKPPEKSTDELIAELKALQRKPNVTPKKTKQQIELEQSRKEWEKYYKDNQGKIPDEFPKTIFQLFNEKYLKENDKKEN